MLSITRIQSVLVFISFFLACVSAFPNYHSHKNIPPTKTSVAVPAPTQSNQCNTGSVHCCNQVHDCKSDEVTSLFGLLGLSTEGLTGSVGVSCTPLTLAGLGGGECSASPVCCSGNHFNGLINVGCSPLSI